MGISECLDIASIISQWHPETLTVWRNTPVHGASGAIDSWAQVESFTGDWQPASARTERHEEGLEVKSIAFIIAPCNLDVEEDDQVRRANGETSYVNYVKLYAGHTTIYLKRMEGQA